jgi:hypothetical protein
VDPFPSPGKRVAALGIHLFLFYEDEDFFGDFALLAHFGETDRDGFLAVRDLAALPLLGISLFASP